MSEVAFSKDYNVLRLTADRYGWQLFEMFGLPEVARIRDREVHVFQGAGVGTFREGNTHVAVVSSLPAVNGKDRFAYEVEIQLPNQPRQTYRVDVRLQHVPA